MKQSYLKQSYFGFATFLLLCGGSAAAAPCLADLAWLQGAWTGDAGGGRAVDSQMDAPEGGIMIGTTRFLQGGQVSFYELDLIEASSDGQLVLTPSPFGQKGVSFPLVELAPGHAVFANAAHDWPREIEYRLTPEGDLYTRVSGVQNGQPSTLAYTQKKGR